MRGYRCYFYKMLNGVIQPNPNDACWAGMRYWSNETIYISRFTESRTKKYIPILVDLINKITPCELVIVNDVEYIKIKLLSTYDQSLILLNFIRYLWNEPAYFDIDLFFEFIEKDETMEEPLEKLMLANILACSRMNGYTGDHSNTVMPAKGAIKNTKQLLEFKGKETQEFLTT